MSSKSSWYRELAGGRLQVCLYGPDLTVRASGPAESVWPLVESFENLTGMTIEAPWRRPSLAGHRVIAGQLELVQDGTHEMS